MAIIDDRTPVGNYPKPHELNKLRDDVVRLREAFDAFAVSIAAALAATDGKAPLVHSHAMAAITGLLDALAGLAAKDHQHALDDLSDVSVAGAANRALMMKIGASWGPGNILLADVVGWEDTVNALIAAAVAAVATNMGKRSRVRVVATGNINIATALNPGDVLNGVTLVAGDLVLVPAQTAPAQNGVYVVAAVPVRSTEYDAWDKFPGSLVAVAEGTVNADTVWLCTSNAGGTLGTTAIAFDKLNAFGALLAASNLADLASVPAALGNLGLTNALLSNVAALLTAGFTTTSVDDGNSGTAAYTPSPATGNFRRRTVTGAHQFNAPTAANDFTMIVLQTNGAGAGGTTMNGFTKVTGDAFTTTVGDRFVTFILKIFGITHAHVVALQ